MTNMSFEFRALEREDWNLLEASARPPMCEDSKGIVAVREDGKVEGIVILDAWSKNCCQLHISIFNPFVLKHGFQSEVFNFVFNTAKRGVIICNSPSDKPKAIALCKHMGFTEIFRIKDGCEEGVDCLIHELRKEDCRWIKQPQIAVGG